MCANHESFKRMRCWYYCRSGNIRKVLIFSTFARRSNLRIEEFRENYYHKSDTFIEIDNLRILDFTRIPKITTSRKSKHAKNTRPDSMIRWYCSPDIRCRKRWEQLTSISTIQILATTGLYLSLRRIHIGHWFNAVPTNTRRCPNAGLMMAHRLWRWPNIKPALGLVSCFVGHVAAVAASVKLSRIHTQQTQDVESMFA